MDERRGPTGAVVLLWQQGCTLLAAPAGEKLFTIYLSFDEGEDEFVLPASTNRLPCHPQATSRGREGETRGGGSFPPSQSGRPLQLRSRRTAAGSCRPVFRNLDTVDSDVGEGTSVFQWRARDTARRRKTPRQTRSDESKQYPRTSFKRQRPRLGPG